MKYMLEHTCVGNAQRATVEANPSSNLSHLKRFLLRKNIESFAKKIGFDLVGFSPAKIEDKYLKPFENWLKEGRNGTMEYMKKIEQRRDLTKILPGAKSVIVLAMNYYNEQSPLRKNHGRVARYAYGRDYHKVIKKMLKKVEEYIATLVYHAPPGPPIPPSVQSPVTRSYVDTGPVLERALAEQAGLGRIGKNTCLITKEYGSWVFLTEIITTLDLVEPTVPAKTFSGTPPLSSLSKSNSDLKLLPGERLDHEVVPGQLLSPDRTDYTKVSPGTLFKTQTAYLRQENDQKLCLGTSPKSKIKITAGGDSQGQAILDRWQDPKGKSFNVCGNCTRCVTACPTGAIIAPGVIDARLCISYLTIENKDKIPPKLAKIIKKTKRLYGCDICQEVCPHNNARQKDINKIPAHQAAKLALNSNLATPTNFIPSSPLSSAKNPTIAGDQLNLKTFTSHDGPFTSDQHFLKTFAGSALIRAKRKGLKRNVKAILRNF